MAILTLDIGYTACDGYFKLDVGQFTSMCEVYS